MNQFGRQLAQWSTRQGHKTIWGQEEKVKDTHVHTRGRR